MSGAARTDHVYGQSGGAPMAGVISLPLNTSEKIYKADFQSIYSNKVGHPFTTTTCSSGSTPHNILTGTAFTPSAYKAGMVKSEYTRQFNSDTCDGSKATMSHASGGRVEQLCRLT